jgi:hypothetical protein
MRLILDYQIYCVSVLQIIISTTIPLKSTANPVNLILVQAAQMVHHA